MIDPATIPTAADFTEAEQLCRDDPQTIPGIRAQFPDIESDAEAVTFLAMLLHAVA
jgi:hypothetical protein